MLINQLVGGALTLGRLAAKPSKTACSQVFTTVGVLRQGVPVRAQRLAAGVPPQGLQPGFCSQGL